MFREGLFKAIKFCGSQQALADALGVTQPYINQLLNRDPNIPDLYAIEIHILTQGNVSLEELSPNSNRIHQLIESCAFYHKFPTKLLHINEIKIENIPCPIHRNGELSLFIFQNDFLPLPILVDTQNRLLTCKCRILANILCKNKKIAVHQINLSDVILGKKSISALIDRLPISERVLVAMAIERELRNRLGRRPILHPGEQNLDIKFKNLTEKKLKNVDIYPHIPAGIKSRTIASKIGKFNSDFLYRQAKFVIEHGIPELIQAMDDEKLSISKAKQMAVSPPEAQYEYITKLTKQIS
jgi:DNA-binding transcriptional regulator YdaS (Cro superfamily)